MNKIFCLIFGHKYFLVSNFNQWSRKIGCKRCGSLFAMNDDTMTLLPWDSDFEQLYNHKAFFK